MIEKKQLLSIGKAAEMLGVTVMTLRRWDDDGILASVRVGEGATRYYSYSTLEQFLLDRSDLATIAKKWVTDDTPADLSSSMYCQTRDVFVARLGRLQRDLEAKYPDDKIVAFLLPAIVGEIGNNSFDHNIGSWPDIPGILFAHNANKKRIVLADRGQGVFQTLSRVRSLVDDVDALQVAFTDIVSGRHPEARGNGLKFVRANIIANSFKLIFQSGDAKLQLQQNDSDLDIQKVETKIHGCLAIIDY